jgi:hypothetical protein
MPRIGIIVSYKHRPGMLKELQEWLKGQGPAMLAAACGANERYIGVYMIEGDPTYSIQVLSYISVTWRTGLSSPWCNAPALRRGIHRLR